MFWHMKYYLLHWLPTLAIPRSPAITVVKFVYQKRIQCHINRECMMHRMISNTVYDENWMHSMEIIGCRLKIPKTERCIDVWRDAYAFNLIEQNVKRPIWLATTTTQQAPTQANVLNLLYTISFLTIKKSHSLGLSLAHIHTAHSTQHIAHIKYNLSNRLKFIQRIALHTSCNMRCRWRCCAM